MTPFQQHVEMNLPQLGPHMPIRMRMCMLIAIVMPMLLHPVPLAAHDLSSWQRKKRCGLTCCPLHYCPWPLLHVAAVMHEMALDVNGAMIRLQRWVCCGGCR